MAAAELLTGLGLFKTAFDMAKGLKDINDAAVRNGAVIELQEMILSAQNQQSALIERVRELEEQVTHFENWEAEKQRYQLTDNGLGVMAYTLKPGMENGQPPHSICAGCYERRQKSILQPETRSLGRTKHLVCHQCGSDLIVVGGRSVREDLPTHAITGRKQR
jgi:hypothetical protein